MSHWEKSAAYGGIAAGALCGWTTRFYCKVLFAKHLGVTGSVAGEWSEGGIAHADMPANMLGALIFGIVSRCESQLKPWHPSIYLGAAVGFCGSCTTFSTWMVEAGVMLWSPSNTTPAVKGSHHDWWQEIVRAFLLVLIGFLCIMTSLHIGQWLGDVISLNVQRRIDRAAVQQSANTQGMGLPLEGIQDFSTVPESRKPLYQREKSFLYWTVVLALWSSAAIVYFPAIRELIEDEDDIHTKRALDLFAGLCLAPFGAWLRFVLAKFNSRSPSFPQGTFAANILGTSLSITCWIAAAKMQCQDHPETTRVGQRLHECTWVAATSGGFCGCLTTASTLANELDKLSRNKDQVSTKALKYGMATMFAAQLVVATAVNTYFLCFRDMF
jgi:fluoride ion exporter CrcB/FEX